MAKVCYRKTITKKKHREISSLLVRPRSSSVKFRIRPETAPNLLRQSADPYASIAPAWRPGGSIKRPKFIGSQAPPTKPKPPPPEPTWNPGGTLPKKKPIRALDPTSISIPKPHEPVWNPSGTVPNKKPVRAFDPTNITIPRKAEPVWNPSSTKPPKKPVKHFEPAMKPELITPVQKQTAPIVRKKTVIPNANPLLKTRVANAESKVKSAWKDPPVTIQKPKPPSVPRPIGKTTTPLPPKPRSISSAPAVPVKKTESKPPLVRPTKIDTDRSSLPSTTSKPMFESTPRNQSPIHDADDLFDQETQISTSRKTRMSFIESLIKFFSSCDF